MNTKVLRPPMVLTRSRHWLTQRNTFAVLLLGALLIPLTGIYTVVLAKILCLGLFACALNLLLGYVGLLSFGHAAFLGSSAYMAGYAMKHWSFNPEFGLLLGTATAALLGLVFGALTIRRKGIYFAMITMALGQIVYFVALQMPESGGEDGLLGIPRNHLFGFIDLNEPTALYYFVLVIFVLGFSILYRTVHSPFGQAMRAIRDNADRATSLGFDVNRCKLIAFVISAAIAGLAGASKVLVFQVATLNDVGIATSGAVILMVILGGMGTHLGPLVGAMLVVALEYLLAERGSWVTVIEGAVFMICVLLFRKGIVGELQYALEKRRESTKAR